MKNEIKAKWIERAIEIGDPTARETAEANSIDPDIWNKLVVHSIIYHEEEDENAKQEPGGLEVQPEVRDDQERPALKAHPEQSDEKRENIRQLVQEKRG